MRAAALQFDVRRGDVAANLASVERGLLAARDANLELVVLPEMWPTSFPDADLDLERALDETNRALERIRELSRELRLAIAGSSFARGELGERPRNRLQLFVDGELAFAYDKVHLFSPTAETESFSAGSAPPPTVATKFGRTSGVVCYDLRFPELWHRAHRDEVELMLVSAQWPTPRAAQFRALVHGLAAANQCAVIACNRTGRDAIGRRRMELEFPGNSLIVAASGATIMEGHGEEGLLFAEVDLDEARELKRKIPVDTDRRGDLYETW